MNARTNASLIRRSRRAGSACRRGSSLLTILFVMLAEVLIYVPSVANFRRNWLNDRLAAAQIAALVLDAAPEERLSEDLEARLLAGVGAEAIAVRGGGRRRLLVDERDAAGRSRRPSICAMRPGRRSFATPSTHSSIRRRADPRRRAPAWAVRFRRDDPRPAALAGRDARILPQHPAPLAPHLRHHREPRLPRPAMGDRAAGAPALGQHRGLRGQSRGRLAGDPADRPGDEIGLAEQALAQMEATLADELRQKRRLAELGLAVSKINHELRNMLTTAQLLTDRLERVSDEAVQRVAPRLVAHARPRDRLLRGDARLWPRRRAVCRSAG